LDAQRESVRALVSERGWILDREFQETESGKRADRPELMKAIAHARRVKGCLVIACFDRLARNVRVTATLMEGGVEFIAADMPFANKLTIHILAAMAEHEREMISKRTKDALAAAKRRGVRLGSHRAGHWTAKRHAARLKALARGRETAARSHRAKALKEYADLAPIVSRMRKDGATFQAIADHLNGEGYTTRRGKAFFPAQVRNLLHYLANGVPVVGLGVMGIGALAASM
jgi:DNA invertase Pin-like site-specific DNA recombinase